MCLLLSERRKYPDGMFDNERWAARAQQLLQQAENHDPLSQTDLHHVDSKWWKVVYCCCHIRAQRILIGTHRNASITASPTKIPRLTLADLEDDVRLPWFLDTATKRKLAQVFVAFVNIQRIISPLSQIVLRHESGSDAGLKGVGSAGLPRGSVMGILEEVESSLVEWRAQYEELMLIKWDDTRKSNPASPPCLAVATSYMNLGYEYVIVTSPATES